MGSPLDSLKWFGHASFLVVDKQSGQRFYYIDPYDLNVRVEPADLILVTHAHYDHCSPADVKRILTPKTVVVGPRDCLEKLGIPRTQAMPMAPHAEFAVRGVPIKAVPAYNVKEERLSYHPKRNGWVGFVLTVNGVRIYHAGDTDFIPEMKDLGNIDVALLPIGGTYTMDAAEAAQAANAIAAKVTVPMHYKALLKDKAWQAEETFQAGVRGKVELLDEVK